MANSAYQLADRKTQFGQALKGLFRRLMMDEDAASLFPKVPKFQVVVYARMSPGFCRNWHFSRERQVMILTPGK
jgi:hypothetical protein